MKKLFKDYEKYSKNKIKPESKIYSESLYLCKQVTSVAIVGSWRVVFYILSLHDFRLFELLEPIRIT